VRFIKMHGLGNDYVFIDAIAQPALLAIEDWPALARALADRHRGVGGDGLILVTPPPQSQPQNQSHAPDPSMAHAGVRIFNADGGEAEMCGNGLRCVAKLLHDRHGLTDSPLRLAVAGAVVAARVHRGHEGVDQVELDLGPPGLTPADAGLDTAQLVGDRPRPCPRPHDRDRAGGEPAAGPHAAGRQVVAIVDGRALALTPVSLGNPHAVAFVEDNPWLEGQGPDGAPRSAPPAAAPGGFLAGGHGPGEPLAAAAARLGPALNRHPAFPRGVNVHVARVADDARAIVRTWERGSGPTRACGSGAGAVMVAGVIAGRLAHRATIALAGGELELAWTPTTSTTPTPPPGDGRVRLRGPAVECFEGEWSGNLDDLRDLAATLAAERPAHDPRDPQDTPAYAQENPTQ